MLVLSALALLAAVNAGSPGPQFPPSTNWSVASQPPPRAGSCVNTVSVNVNGTLGWNGSPIVDDQLRTYAGITSQMRGAMSLVLILRAGVAEHRRDELIRIISDAKTCQGDHECTLIENWPADFPAYFPPPPPAPPRKR